MGIIQATKVLYEYIRRDEEGNAQSVTKALDDVNVDIKAGSFVGILGHNGSGKSTLARHFNALLTPQEGTVIVDGKNTSAEQNIQEIRRAAGMVFQNPDNQIVASVVEEDVAFGPENMGLASEQIEKRITEALDSVQMSSERFRSPGKLSGGQKQRVAIAGVVAMRTKCIILDEPTAMLDPMGREMVLSTIKKLNRDHGVTIILITHNMEEVVDADTLFVMKEGKVLMQGTPEEVFAQEKLLSEAHLQLPQVTQMANCLREYGLSLSNPILTTTQLVREILHLRRMGAMIDKLPKTPALKTPAGGDESMPTLIIDHVTASYGVGTPFEKKAVDDVSFQVKAGEFIGLIGHTGSGKSTLVQLLNGLITPQSGSVFYEGTDISNPEYDKRKLRTCVGLVFQYPEHQLFEATVLKDVAFGPKNMGMADNEAELRAFEALQLIGVDAELFNQSPFELSGGQKRRVAIAGILAMKPRVLIMDEPTAGLDPESRDELLALIDELRIKQNMAVILVSHSMEDVARYADRLLVMNQGKLVYNDKPHRVFAYAKELEKIGLKAPESAYVTRELRLQGLEGIGMVTTMDEAVYEIGRQFAIRR
ncbi:energy-coupling factor transporter ATPase [Eubacterium oxidoreducens]|uniref:Energy-coupling factor transporter ATP-binding protein EcfA2 n=1 Tax=Eubacterium oxidoreducens TaxID=1732 RepID=A0A1G6CE77_EUBOX|nr:energy-coupling factor transporter ATPase [Eubacterium oxidoreducens]SDB31135.1 energy-coupling factor transport system ATP-binding protein [Eubacterium oxidoreducens]